MRSVISDKNLSLKKTFLKMLSNKALFCYSDDNINRIAQLIYTISFHCRNK